MAIQLKIDRVLQGSFDLKALNLCLCFKSIVLVVSSMVSLVNKLHGSIVSPA